MTHLETHDDQPAHRRFAVDCFNLAWELIARPDRSEVDTAEMIHLAHTSRWHWEQFDGHTREQLSIGDWQLARVYALAGRAGEAHRYALSSLRIAEAAGLEPFHIAYGHEALARAAAVAEDPVQKKKHLAEALRHLANVTEADEREVLEADLRNLAD